ncbi:MAG: ribose 5-phosphate isomerase B [Cryomorphaceae bacterium]|nr:ribose 5-phosphate isomerase B [Flavobacteriales bacterium]
MNIYIGSDHAGFDLKELIIKRINTKFGTLVDKGTFSSESTDYPDFAHAVAELVEREEGALGILICGSANGVSMAANKHAGVRCAICWNKEIAELARLHNDANILALPARFISSDLALELVEAFFTNEFEGGRHARRVNKIACS